MTPTLLGPLPDGLIETVATVCRWAFLLCIIPIIWPLRHPMGHPKRTHPQPVTWLTWFLVGSMATIGQAFGGAAPDAWLGKLFLSIGPLIVGVLALARREPVAVNAVDRWSLALCAVGVALYVPLTFGWIGPADPVTAGLIVINVAIVVDTIAAVPTCRSTVQRYVPAGEIVTFAIVLPATLVTLAILPVPWTWLSNALFCVLALQMIAILTTMVIGRRRHAPGTVEPEPVALDGGLASDPCADSVTTPVSRSSDAST
jgi:hypothetical protein